MKKTLFILSVFAFAFAACEKVTETYEDPATQLEVTTSYVIFSADGGSKTVLVTSNTDWTCAASDSWYSVAQGEGELVISADANTTGANRYSTLTVSAGELSETISVAQALPSSVPDLSEYENANCYIAKTGTAYRFDATVKGNGQSVDFGGIAAYVDKYGTTIDPSEIIYADLIWESTFNADKTSSHNIIDGQPVYSGGYVYFTTGESEGNAAIAVRDAQGTILWSWHIWVTDDEIAETYGNGYHWQDRNLGAVTAAPGDINNRGLLYQWGRKDPFLPSSAEYGADETVVYNYQVGDGSGEWNYTDYSCGVVTSAPGNIPFTVKNPMAFILYNGSVYSWYLSKDNDDNDTNYLWGDSSDLSTYVKSIFDPCPPGYNVPVDNPWVSDKDQDVNYWSAGQDYGRYWTGGNNAFYPFAGYLNGSSGIMYNTSDYGYYWSSGKYSDETYYGRYFYFNSGSALYYSFTYPVHAFSVRCMRAE